MEENVAFDNDFVTVAELKNLGKGKTWLAPMRNI